jgi:hypothetical protein
VDASDETQTPFWKRALLENNPDPFEVYRATRMTWSFDLKVSPPSSGGDVVTLDNALFSRFIKFGRMISFPEVYLQPPIEQPSHPGFFSNRIGGLNLRLRATNLNVAYWESRDVRDPVGFKCSIASLEFGFQMTRRVVRNVQVLFSPFLFLVQFFCFVTKGKAWLEDSFGSLSSSRIGVFDVSF